MVATLQKKGNAPRFGCVDNVWVISQTLVSSLWGTICLHDSRKMIFHN